jgi:lipoprotein-anchoring transpeptidase ErfK/SrfK
VGGLGADAAYQAVHLAFEAPLVVRVGEERISVAPAQLGTIAYVKATVAQALKARAGRKLPLRVRVEGSALRNWVTALAERIDQKALDASVFLRGLAPVVTTSRSGRALDQKQAARLLVAALAANRRTGIRLPLETLKPNTTTSDFGPVIVIRRGSNHLYLYSGERLVRMFGVATGQAAYPTPLGHFSIVVKWRDPWWYPPDSPWAQGAQPIPPGPGNPLGTRWMGLSAPGVGIHGTPDPASIGYSLSHGCIRMYIPEAEWLFNHVDIGTPVFIVAA